MYTCISGIDFASVSTNGILDFGTFQTKWHFSVSHFISKFLDKVIINR